MSGDFGLTEGDLVDYLSDLFEDEVRIESLRTLGGEEGLKGFGYGHPLAVSFTADGERRQWVFSTVNPEGFGHERPSDRAELLIWKYGAFNQLPRHVRAVDLGVLAQEDELRSIGDFREFFLVTEFVDGEAYYRDLDRLIEGEELRHLDRERCLALSDYLVEIHTEGGDPGLYRRRVRELVGSGECIMGLVDSYPVDADYLPPNFLLEFEKRAVEWRHRLRKVEERCRRVHGDFHPWNVLFRDGTDFTTLDRSRGKWGEAADDVVAMTINYLFYAVRADEDSRDSFLELFRLFWDDYLDSTGDEEMLRVVQPFYAWRALVLASPVWYPDLQADTREKILSFGRWVLDVKELTPEEAADHLVG